MLKNLFNHLLHERGGLFAVCLERGFNRAVLILIKIKKEVFIAHTKVDACMRECTHTHPHNMSAYIDTRIHIYTYLSVKSSLSSIVCSKS